MSKTEIYMSTGTHRGWSETELQTVKGLMEDGVSMRQISEMFKVSKHAIFRLNKKYKWKIFPNKKLGRIALLAEMIKKLYLLPPDGEGFSAIQVGKELDISPTTVRAILNKIGEKVRCPLESFTDKRKEAITERNIAWWSDPENKQYMKDFKERYWSDEKNREKHSKIMKKIWDDNPHLKERDSEKQQKFWDNYPGGFKGWINEFSEEKQKIILNAIHASK